MALTLPEPTTATPTYSSRGSTCTITRPAAANTSPEQCSWTWSPAPWTVCGPDPSDRSSDQTTLSSDRVEREIIGQRVITQKVSSCIFFLFSRNLGVKTWLYYVPLNLKAFPCQKTRTNLPIKMFNPNLQVILLELSAYYMD